MTAQAEEQPDVLIIGAGPAGLSAAARLAPYLSGSVLVLDRESDAGGIPRHSDHTGYGLRDVRRVMTGPAYARRLAQTAIAAGAEIRTRAMVTGWTADGAAQVTSPAGLYTVRARATILAIGARERPRAARRVPGDRPDGVYTTGHLQNLVHLRHSSPGTRAVVVGTELVSWSAVLTLRESSCQVVTLVTTQPRPESYAAVTGLGRLALRTPVLTATRVVGIVGKRRVEAVEIEDLRTGRRARVDCDTVVFTGDWIPDHELGRLAGLDIDPGSLAPIVDSALRTSQPGVFAAGNLTHPVDTADVCALAGRHVAESVRRWLETGAAASPGVRLLVEPPLAWVSPGVVRQGGPPPSRGRLLLASATYVRFPRVSVQQAGATITTMSVPWPAAPGRLFRLPSRLLDRVDHQAGDVTITLR